MRALARGRLGAVVPAATRAACRSFAAAAQPEFLHEDLFQSTGALPHSYRLLTSDHVSTFDVRGKTMLAVAELGMEAVWKIEVEDFPAFVVVDDKGNDFFDKWSH